MDKVSEIVTTLFGAVVIAAMGFEINRRRKHLREVYDVLDSDTKHVAATLEEMVSQGALRPYLGETWE
ncbi:hypothetical protein [Methyloterricola oryzae]|uniref:hypothetical protein n=1 Tax=Methyloterricola oryzae TaxID=1495050 RepID=UPI0005EAEA78|nr:hypothetical protein [Methyloterricola oryzae]